MANVNATGSVPFETPQSFVGKVFASPFYFKYLYPATRETIDLTAEGALKSKIEQLALNNDAFKAGIYGLANSVKRIFFVWLVVFPAASLGFIRNSALTAASLLPFTWSLSRSDSSSVAQKKLQESWERVWVFGHATWIDYQLARLPLLYLVGRSCVNALSKIQVKPHVIPAYTRFVTLLTRLGLGVLALDAIWQTYRYVSQGETLQKFVGDAIANTPSEIYGSTLSHILREKFGAQGGILTRLSPQEARAKLAEVYNGYQEELGIHLFEINNQIYQWNLELEVLLPNTGLFTASEITFDDLKNHPTFQSLEDGKKQLLITQIGRAEKIRKRLVLCENLASPLTLAELMQMDKSADQVYERLVLAHLGNPNTTTLEEKHRDAIVEAKIWLIKQTDELTAVQAIAKTWDVNKLIGFFGKIQNPGEEVNKFKNSLSKIRAELVWYNKTRAVTAPYLGETCGGGPLFPGSSIMIPDLVENGKKAYMTACTSLANDAYNALLTQLYLNAWPLMCSLRMIPQYNFPLGANQTLNRLKKVAFVVSGESKKQVDDCILTLEKSQKKFDLAEEAIKMFGTLAFDELALYSNVRKTYSAQIASAERNLVNILVRIDNQFNIFQNKQIRCQNVQFALPIDGKLAISQMRLILSSSQFSKENRDFLNALIANAEEEQNRIENFRKADSALFLNAGTKFYPFGRIEPSDIVYRDPSKLLSYIDFATTIKVCEAEEAQIVGSINGVLHALNAAQIPYACPLDVEQILTNLINLRAYLSELSNAQANKSLLEELDDLRFKLLIAKRTLAIFKKLHPQVESRNFRPPTLYMDRAEHKKLFEGDNSNGGGLKEALSNCKLENVGIDPQKSTKYNEFKVRIVAYKQGQVQDAWSLLGLSSPDTAVNIGRAKRQYALHLRSDGITYDEETRMLFECMNALVAICEAELEKQQSVR